jgi:hypothetical protein
MTASLLLLLLPVLGACSVLMPPKRYGLNAQQNDGWATPYGPAQPYDFSIERGLTPRPY